jgi:dimethylhistidine N-methyltransferase
MSHHSEKHAGTPSIPSGLSASEREMFVDVYAGLSSSPKTLPSKYFYDEVGSRLFDEITGLDEYYVTRAETVIMEQHVAGMIDAIGPDVLLVEYGSGSSVKTRILLDHMESPVGYVPIDISGEYLHGIADNLRDQHPDVPILPLVEDFTQPFTLPEPARAPARRVVYFPGSTIGNFSVPEAVRLLKAMRSVAGPSGAILIGFDLVKPLNRLRAAYNDDAGVTARFNLNLLHRLNTELGADFDLDAFRHDAPFNEEASRIEMHLVSRTHQVVQLGEHDFHFDQGESILTEFSHKYTVDSFQELAHSAGLEAIDTWIGPDRLFCVQLLGTPGG